LQTYLPVPSNWVLSTGYKQLATGH